MKKAKIKKPEYPKSFETFQVVGDWQIRDLTRLEPSCFNGQVKIRKYRITIEEIEEPIIVLQERVQKLWDYCDNMHHWNPLKDAAKELMYELSCSPGNSLPNKIRVLPPPPEQEPDNSAGD